MITNLKKKKTNKQKKKKKKKKRKINYNIKMHRQVRLKIYINFISMKIENLERRVHIKYSHVAVIIEVNKVNYSSLTNNRFVK